LVTRVKGQDIDELEALHEAEFEIEHNPRAKGESKRNRSVFFTFPFPLFPFKVRKGVRKMRIVPKATWLLPFLLLSLLIVIAPVCRKDTTAPTVISTEPKDGAKLEADAQVAEITVAFSEDVVGDSVAISVSGDVTGETTYDSKAKKAAFKPSTPLTTGSYTVTVSGAKDKAGNVMKEMKFSFSMEEAKPAEKDE